MSDPENYVAQERDEQNAPDPFGDFDTERPSAAELALDDREWAEQQAARYRRNAARYESGELTEAAG